MSTCVPLIEFWQLPVEQALTNGADIPPGCVAQPSWNEHAEHFPSRLHTAVARRLLFDSHPDVEQQTARWAAFMGA
jgi:hypothetical protein